MLKSLSIKNYALIEELTVEFERGLNVITGETGAGKSIIIDALSLILGERADTDAVRKGAEKAIVEGVLTVAGGKRLKQLLEENEIEFHDDLIVRREVAAKGQSRSFINDTPATTALLKQVGDLLVDLHGQHEHQSLLRSETHVDLLDDFGGLEGLVEEFGIAYRDAHAIIKELNDLKSREQQLMERRTLYEFQVKEIDALSPRAGEEDELENELRILENAEKLFSATERLYQSLYEGENAVHDRLVLTRNELEALAAIDKAFDEAKAEAASATAIVDELAKFIQQYSSRIEFNPERLEEIRNRLGHLTLLKKKYGGTLTAVIELREKIGRELELANNFEEEIAALRKKLDAKRRVCSDIAQRLSAKRQEVAKKVNKSIVQSLAELGIVNAQFETRITHKPALNKETALVKLGKEWIETTSKGIDEVAFHVSTNVGEDVKPLVKVASGGEISRIMLSLKMILAKSDRLPLLIFDEIDVGVSGRIAQAVGRSMKKLSQFHQVIAITHLPQIAGFADTHFVVEKMETDKRAVTSLRKLDENECITEVARLISGAEVTETGLESARELMGLK
ncbi:MAG: DNA repair protein RecN [Ignavibacteriae bacterium]|nr:DNA repair protein RecN [Ignavibacteria bacterium]MBI3365392.1 DNA repair protein RecN [Ignavibacteriota bacterium]